MSKLNLAPYAAHMTWHIPGGITGREWSNLLCRFMEQLAVQCRRTGASLIGHIKGLVVMNDDYCLKVSVTTTDLPADVVGTLPDNRTEIRLALNVLVYGLTGHSVAEIVQSIANSSVSPHGGRVVIAPAESRTRSANGIFSHDRH